MEILEGQVESIVFRNEENGYTVAELNVHSRQTVHLVGTMPLLAAGERVTVEGEWSEHRKYGRQLVVTRYQATVPTALDDLERYLGSGMIRGVGPATAEKMIRHFGEDILTVLEAHPERLTELKGMSEKRALSIAESYREKRQMRSAMVFLMRYGLSGRMCVKIWKRYGDQTERILLSDPYRLAEDVTGIGFLLADRMASSMGVEPENEHRIACGVQYALMEALMTEGHIYVPLPLLIPRAQQLLGVPEALIERAIAKEAAGGMLVREADAVFLANAYEAECEVAERLTGIQHTVRPLSARKTLTHQGIQRYESQHQIQLSDQQRCAVQAAVEGSVTVITGGPGTGKTTIIRCIIDLMKTAGTILLCAPTGRAAKRMSEATGMPASTIHRLLEYGGEEGLFTRNVDYPLDADVLIVDEMSMTDMYLMQGLMRAVRPGTRLVFVGDADQLPSVGAGNVLHDLIDSGTVTVVRLTEIFRQAQQSDIIVNAHRIHKGEMPVANQKGSDFFWQHVATSEDAAMVVEQLVRTRLPAFLPLDPLKDIQVMAPMKRGEAGVIALNRRLQAVLNPDGCGAAEYVRGETVLRVGDKVMQMKNDYGLSWQRGETTGEGVFNGDIGQIEAIDLLSATLTVQFDDGRCAEYETASLENLELAYCMSVHKSQGSEFEVVILPLVEGPDILLTRNLLYTAVTRAKQLVVIVGRDDCVRKMVANDRTANRYTALARRLQENARAFA